jgi:outer membrane scaffolding protein for murein synthesis (MipA/OmpV family)
MRYLFFLIVLFSLSQQSLANKPEQPLWEFGLGIFTLQMPHYLGANQRYHYTAPLPAMIYRGDILKSDRQGIRSEFFQSRHWVLSISLGGSLPVNSEDNKAREGMDDLDPLLEIGPRIQYYFNDNPAANWQLYIDLPVRAAFRFDDLKIRQQGYTSNPALTSDLYLGDFRWSIAGGPQFSDRAYHDYIYSIDEQDVLIDRPFYQSKSGYTGMRISTGVSYRYQRWQYSAFLRYYNLHNSANEDSPLMLEKNYLSAGISVLYYLKSSKTFVQSR